MMTGANRESGQIFYYEVLVADSSFKGAGALTYASAETLVRGQTVQVPVKNRSVLGVVSKQVGRPSFATKHLSATVISQPLPEALVTLAEWMPQYYPASVGETLQQFLPAKLYPLEPTATKMSTPDAQLTPQTEPNADIPSATTTLPGFTLPATTSEQQAVLDVIAPDGNPRPDTYILHGETGSGKTRVYVELALQHFRAGRSSIILTPEIGLTPQLTKTFEQSFGADNIITTHSQLTVKQRSLQWNRAMQSSRAPVIVLGPRSALFLPLQNIGLIILDESHEASYKQENAPHYHAAKVAAKLADLHRATLILGSATPSVSDYYVAEAKGKKILRMTAAATVSQFEATKVDIIDLKDRNNFTKKPHLSNQLISSIELSLRHGEQSLVFLNRRGTARTVLCEACGWMATCGHCDLPLTYHGDAHNLRCHTCGLVTNAFTSCPDCGSAEILMKSIGTKAIVQELQSAFPQASIQRFDTDNSKSERLEAHYHDVRDGKVDIVVGTQIIAKGLDLPSLSTVGIVTADTSLYLPDYSAQERTYQLLRQVIGRVGRGHRAGRIILQTYDPLNPVIQAAAEASPDLSWDSFYQAELAERKAFTFPPFCYTLKLACRRASSKSAEQAAEKVADKLREAGLRIVIDGPMPALHEKHGDKYQWQLICKAKDRRELIKAIKALPANWTYDIDPGNLL